VREEGGGGGGGGGHAPVERKPGTPLAAWAPVGSSGKKGPAPAQTDSLQKKKGKKLLFGSLPWLLGPRPEGTWAHYWVLQAGVQMGTPPTKEAAMLLLLPAKRAAESATHKSGVEEEEEDDEDEGGTLSQLIPNCLPRVPSTNYTLKPHSHLASASLAESEAGVPLWAKRRQIGGRRRIGAASLLLQ